MARQPTLAADFLAEFPRGVQRIAEHPYAWYPLDPTYRRLRLHRFPYGIIYRVDPTADQALIVAIMHLSRDPGWWRRRTSHS